MSKKKINILTAASSLIFGVIIALIVVQYSKYDYLSDLTNGLYKDNSVYFKVNDTDEADRIMDKLSYNEVIFGEINDDYRAVYFNKRYSLPMKKGRFFRKGDFKENNNYVVIGSEHESSVKQIDGRNIFNYEGVDFEVIGIVGMDIASPLDKMIFFNMKNVAKYMAIEDTLFVLSTNNKNSSAIDNADIQIYDVPVVGVHRVINYKVAVFVIAYCCVALTLFCVVSLLYMYLGNQKNKIRAYGIMGFRRSYIVYNIFKEQLKYILVPVIAGTAIFSLADGRLYIGISHIIFMIMMIAFLIVFLLIVLERKIRNILRSGELFYD